MTSKNLILSNADTDSIAFRKQDGSFITKAEREVLLKSLNSIFPEKINWSDDGYFSHLIVLKAKNYIMRIDDNYFKEKVLPKNPNAKQIKLKGSSLKSSTLEPIFKEMLQEFITSLLEDRNDLLSIYHKYIKMSQNIKDIRPWCSKRTLSKTTYESTRENEAKIVRAIQGTDYVEGDKVYCFYTEDDELVLAENFKGSYNKVKFLEKIYKITDRFSSVIDRSQFLNYKLKRNKETLEELLK